MRFIKTFGKIVLSRLLESQVRRLRKRNAFTLIAVAGSVGKTSTKTAIATALMTARKVRYQTGNYNDRLTVPLVFFGHSEPPIFALHSWVKILLDNERQLRKPYGFDTVVVELGPDGPGQMRHFAYLKPDLSVLTAITPEHMEFFKTLDGVAEEEMQIFNYSKKVLVNVDLVGAQYLEGREFEFVSYGHDKYATYHVAASKAEAQGVHHVTFLSGGHRHSTTTTLLGAPGVSIALAAYAVACELGHDAKMAAKMVPHIRPVAGRSQVLEGVNGCTVIDDTYNASPVSVIAALDTLYSFRASQRIAILGSMNELGTSSRGAHQEVGAYCDPKKLSLVITVGHEAKKYLAPAAKERGCSVVSFMSPYEAGTYVRKHLEPGAIILGKGSQNLIYVEEALKPLLAHTYDGARLVRQSEYWLRRKATQFNDAPRP